MVRLIAIVTPSHRTANLSLIATILHSLVHHLRVVQSRVKARVHACVLLACVQVEKRLASVSPDLFPQFAQELVLLLRHLQQLLELRRLGHTRRQLLPTRGWRG